MEILYVLLVLFVVGLMWLIVALVSIARLLNRRTDQAIKLGVGYYLVRKFFK